MEIFRNERNSVDLYPNDISLYDTPLLRQITPPLYNCVQSPQIPEIIFSVFAVLEMCCCCTEALYHLIQCAKGVLSLETKRLEH
jgi:hypothetical protein